MSPTPSASGTQTPTDTDRTTSTDRTDDTTASSVQRTPDDGRPLTIALVVYGDIDATSGGFRYDREVVSRLRARGDTVEVISLPWRRYGRGLLDALDPRIRDRLDRDVDVLVEDGLCHPSVWRHNRRLSGPDAVVGLIHHLRSDDPTERYVSAIRPFERRFVRSVDATIATSQFTRDRVDRIAPSRQRTPTLVAPPAGRSEAATTTPDRVRDRARRGPLRIVFVGNVVPRKNLGTVLDALAGLDQRSEGGRLDPSGNAGRSDGSADGAPEWRLTVVGDRGAAPTHAERLVDRAASLGLDDRVEFVGELSDGDLVSTLDRSHVCCVPARYEAFGMVHLEAMEHGVVPIAGSVGGTGEFLRDGTNGFLVDPTDDRAIADRLERLATDRDRLATLGVAGLRTAERHPDWDETTDRIRAFLRSVVERATRDGNGPADAVGGDAA